MKKLFTLTIILTLIVSCSSESENEPIENEQAGKTFIPDDVFETILINQGYDDVLDNYVETKTIEKISKFIFHDDKNHLSVSNSKGIEDFINLDTLHVLNHKFATIDVTEMKNLKYLYLDYGELESIDISNNTNLEFLILSRNKLVSLDVTKNTNLKNLDVADNQLTSIDLSTNSKLVTFRAYNNSFSSINIPINSNLRRLFLTDSSLPNSFNIGDYPNLTSLALNNCSLTNIDVSNHINFESLSLKNNLLSSLDITNNTKLHTLSTTENPNLNCIKGSDYHINKWNTDKDRYRIDSHTTIAKICN